MKRKVAIIGAGHVGSHVASALMTENICEEILLLDIDQEKARCHGVDLQDMACYLGRNTRVYTGGYDQIGDADVCVLAYCGEIFEEDRLEELGAALDIADTIIPQLKASGFSGVILGITNPCDLVALYFAMKSGLRVLGTGTALDSARFRIRLAQSLGVQPASVEAVCLGEHGNSQVPLYSSVRVGGLALDQLPTERTAGLDREAVTRSTVDAGWEIVIGKGCTEFGIGAAAAQVIRAIFADCGQVLPCTGPYQRTPESPVIFTSLPRVITKDGAEEYLLPPLTEEEQKAFDASCELMEHYRKTYLDVR